MPPSYSSDTKPKSLRILDEISLAEVRQYYGKTPGYDAKSQLFRDLGIPPDYFALAVDDINADLATYAGSKSVTAKGVRNCATIGDFISLYSKAAGATIPPGEPK